MLCDFHLHTNFSADSNATVSEQIERAIALDMKEICITDHHDYDATSLGLKFLLDFEEYFRCLKQQKEAYSKQLCLNIGVEMGLQNHIADYLKDIVHRCPFDFIIGSCHFIDTLDPYDPEYFKGHSEQERYQHFFEVTLRRVQKLDCYDVLGHLDYVVRYGPNTNRFYSYESYREQIDPILKTLIEKGKGLECNTGGIRYGLGHPNPTQDVLKRYRELGGEILTVGSDAHTAEDIGYAFDLLPELLRSCGFRYYTIFHERKPEFLAL